MPGLTRWTQEKDERHPSHEEEEETAEEKKIISVGLIILDNLPNLDHTIWLRPEDWQSK